MSAGRWLRNKGFAYTADQKIARWDDIGGPRRSEKWALQGPLQFAVTRIVTGVVGAAGAFVVWLLGDADSALPAAGGFLIGWVLLALVTGNRMWKRERALCDAWLNKQRRRQEAAGVATEPAHDH